MKKSTENTMHRFGSDVANQVVEALSEKYNFDIEEAMQFMGKLTISDTTNKPSVKKNPTIQLPFCGVIEDTWCQAIKSNHKLFTQCRKGKVMGDIFCKGCRTLANKNGGNPVYGVIQERLDKGYTDKDGKKPKNYGNVMQTLNITREDAEAEAEKLGWTIPEEQFTRIVKKSGRPKKTKSSSDDHEKEDKEDIVASAFRRADKSTKYSDDDATHDDVHRKRKKKITKKTVVTTDTSDDDTDDDSGNPIKKQVKIKEEKTHDEPTHPNPDISEDQLSNSDDEELIHKEIGIETTEVTDSDGTTWLVDDFGKIYDNDENVIGKWDAINKKVIQNREISEDDGEISDLSDLSDLSDFSQEY